jgi:outer membrane immunogenic protein
MKKLLLIGAAFAVLLAPAMAAEKPVRVHKRVRPVVVAAPIYTWTGFYVGGNVGYGWGQADTDFVSNPTILNLFAVLSGGFVGQASEPGFTGHQSVRPEGIIGGAQVGYNWQLSPTWVAGLEADIQASGEKASKQFTDIPSLTPPGLLVGTAVTDYEAKNDWFGTVRGRVGYVWDRVMLYVTGGLAYGEIKLQGTRTASGSAPIGPSIFPFFICLDVRSFSS